MNKKSFNENFKGFFDEEETKKKKSSSEVVIGLSEEEKREIEEEAKALIAAELKRKLKKEYLDSLLKKQRQLSDPLSNTFEDVIIDVAGHSDRIILDGKHYFHGVKYSVNGHVAATIREIMANTWRHEREVQGANRDFYKTPKELTISGTHGVF